MTTATATINHLNPPLTENVNRPVESPTATPTPTPASRFDSAAPGPMGEQVWQKGRVPVGFWDRLENRISYMQWLGRKLNFQTLGDWYKLTKKHFDLNHGAGLLALKYHASPLAALQEYRPNVDWKEWLFKSAPQGFWKNRGNRRRYMVWLAGELGIHKTEDWYRVCKEDFHANNGGGFLSNVHHDSPIAAVKEFEPDYPWKEWLFHSVPKNFWRNSANRCRYMNWLAEKLDLQTPAAWERVSKQDFYANGGGGLLANYYGDSPVNAVAEFLELTREPVAEEEDPTTTAA